VEALFSETYGSEAVDERFRHWQLFFLICEEMFNLNKGEEYLVSHYLFEKPA
jgi:cyclopropane-fatty-acyl-phospholipid synthase